jgi:hypothetical protein
MIFSILSLIQLILVILNCGRLESSLYPVCAKVTEIRGHGYVIIGPFVFRILHGPGLTDFNPPFSGINVVRLLTGNFTGMAADTVFIIDE